jgi:hypothetical protein
MNAWQFGAAALAASSVSASAKTAGDVMIPVQRIPWAVEAPGQPQRLGALWGNRSTGPAGTLLKVPGGFVAPVHTHTADYRAVVIEGIWKHWPEGASKDDVVALRPGSYWTQEARKWHADACVSKAPCTILLINTEPYRTALKRDQ